MLEVTHVLSERIVLQGEVGSVTINHLGLSVEEAEELYEQLEVALREAGVIPIEVLQEPKPRHGVVIDGLGGTCLEITNYGGKPVSLMLANGKSLVINPREAVPVWGAALYGATIAEML